MHEMANKMSPAANTPAFEKAYGAGAYSGDDFNIPKGGEDIKKVGNSKETVLLDEAVSEIGKEAKTPGTE